MDSKEFFSIFQGMRIISQVKPINIRLDIGSTTSKYFYKEQESILIAHKRGNTIPTLMV